MFIFKVEMKYLAYTVAQWAYAEDRVEIKVQSHEFIALGGSGGGSMLATKVIRLRLSAVKQANYVRIASG